MVECLKVKDVPFKKVLDTIIQRRTIGIVVQSWDCRLCGKYFTRKRDIIIHIINEHMNDDYPLTSNSISNIK